MCRRERERKKMDRKYVFINNYHTQLFLEISTPIREQFTVQWPSEVQGLESCTNECTNSCPNYFRAQISRAIFESVVFEVVKKSDLMLNLRMRESM